MSVNSQISLNPIVKENLKELKRLNLIIFSGIHYGPKFYRDVLDSGVYSRMAYCKGQPIGAICCAFEKTQKTSGKNEKTLEEKLQGAKEKKELLILTLGVLAHHRCQGVGSLLLQHALDHARRDSVSSICLHVQVNNHLAMDFYKTFHFDIKEEKKNYYRRLEPSDAYVLELKLNE